MGKMDMGVYRREYYMGVYTITGIYYESLSTGVPV